MNRKIAVCIVTFLLLFVTMGCKQGDKSVSSGSSLMLASSMPELSASTDLTVVSATPKGDASIKDPIQGITIRFNQPMVPLTAQENDRKDIVNFSPAIDANYRWIGSATCVVVPKKPLLADTEYKGVVPAGIKAFSGATLKKEFSWSFYSMQPAISCSLPSDGQKAISISSPLFLCFNQPVKPETAEKLLKLYKGSDSKENIEFKLRTFNKDDEQLLLKKMNSNPESYDYKTVPDTWKPENILLLTPAAPLERNTDYKLSLQNVKSGKALNQIAFRTEKEFKLSQLPSRQYAPSDTIELQFSNPLSEEQLEKNLKLYDLTENKEVPCNKENYMAFENYINADFIPHHKYQILVSKDIEDLNGNKLGSDSKLEFIMGNYRPSFGIPESNGILETALNGRFPVSIMNMDKIYMLSKSLSVDELIHFSKMDYERQAGYILDSSNVQYKTIDCHSPENVAKNIPIQIVKNPSSPFNVVAFSEKPFAANSDCLNQYSIVQNTNLAIDAKLAPDNGMVWVTSLDKGNPVVAAKVEVRYEDGTLLWSGTTDSDGIVKLPAYSQLLSKIAQPSEFSTLFFFAYKGNDVSYISNSYSWVADLWRANIDVCELGQNRPTGALFTEKGIYSANQQVKLKGVLRVSNGFDWSVPQNKSVTIEISSPNGDSRMKKSVTLSEQGTFSETYDLGNKPQNGGYTITLLQNDMYIASNSFYVADYKPAPFKVTPTLSAQGYFKGDNVSGNISAQWLFGAPLSGNNVNWNITCDPSSFTPKDFDDYSFGVFDLSDSESTSISIASGKGQLNSNGKLSVSASLKDLKVTTPQTMTFEATATGASNESISNRITATIHPAQFYVGIKNSSYFVSKGESEKFSIISVTPDSKLTSGSSFKGELISREWESVRVNTLGSGTSWESKMKDTVLKTFNGKFDNKPYEYAYKPEKAGYYVLRVTSQDSKKNSVVSESSFYVSGSDYVAWERNNDDFVEILLDKKSYKPGETAKLIIKSPYESAKALLTVEKNGILKKELVNIKGSIYTYNLPITGGYSPNVYFSALLVQGRRSVKATAQDRDPGKPSFKIGAVKIPVTFDREKISIKLDADKKSYAPSDQVTLKLHMSDINGAPVKGEVVLAVVDSGVLALRNYEFPNLYDLFYNSHPLRVTTMDSRRNVIGDRNYNEKGDKADGGGGDESAASQSEDSATRSNFVETAYWNPELKTDSSGNATVSFKLPDNLTTFKVMALGIANQKFSETSTTDLLVTEPLVMNSALPLFIGAGDTFMAAVSLVNRTDKAQNAIVSIDVKGAELADSKNQTSVYLEPNKDVVVPFKVSAPKKGEATFEFSVSMGDYKDKIKLNLPVLFSSSFIESVCFSGVSDDMIHQENILIPDTAIPDTLDVKLSASSTILEDLRLPLEFLKNYKYSSVETKISKVLPYLTTKELNSYLKLDNSKGEQKIRATIEDIAKNQTSNGGFSFWGGAYPSPFLSIYATHFVTLAKQDGILYADLYSRGVEYLKSLLRDFDKAVKYSETYNSSEKEFLKAYALYVLSLAGESDQTSFNNMYDNVERMEPVAQAFILAVAPSYYVSPESLSSLKDKILNKFVVDNRIATLPEESKYGYMVYNSPNRSDAIALYALLHTCGNFELAPKIANSLVSNIKNGSWQGPQETVWSLIALNEYFKVVEGGKFANLPVTLRWGDKELISSKIDADSNKRSISVDVPKDLLNNKKEVAVRFEKGADAKLYYTLMMEYALKSGLKATNQGFSVLKKIEQLNGTSAHKGVCTAGELYKVTISVISPVDRSNVVVNEPIPAGFKVVDTHLSTESQATAKLLSYVQKMEGKKSESRNFSNVEIHKDNVILYIDYMQKGEYIYTYFMKATTPGKYRLAPTKAMMIYNPELFGVTDDAVIEVE